MSTRLSLDDFNKQFQESIDNKRNVTTQKNRTKLKKYLPLVIAVIAITIVITVIAVSQFGNDGLTLHKIISSEDEYLEQYTNVISDREYMGINTTVYISDSTAHLGLVNSIGNNSAISVRIYNKDTEEVLYNSGSIMPGSIVHLATLDSVIDNLDKLNLEYTVYDLETAEQKEYQANVKFEFHEEEQ
ncbi:MAG: hypothetical protein ACK5LL_01130 [Suipraeoptans sp.]